MNVTRRAFLALLAGPLLLPAAPQVQAPPPAPAGDDHPAFSEFAETTLVTQWNQTP